MGLILARVLLAVGMAIFGFGLALELATDVLYPGPPSVDTGLARVSIAVLGAVAGVLTGIALGLRLRPPRLTRVALAALLAGVAVLGMRIWLTARARQERQRLAPNASRRPSPSLTTNSRQFQGVSPSSRVNSTPRAAYSA